MSPENLSWIGVRVWDRAEVKMPRVLSPPSLHTAVISARDRCSLLLFLGPKMDSVPKSTSPPIKKENLCADYNIEKCSLLRFCRVCGQICCSTVCCPTLFKLQGGGLPTSGTEVDPTRSGLHPRGALHGGLKVLESLSLSCPVVLPQAVEHQIWSFTQNRFLRFLNLAE